MAETGCTRHQALEFHCPDIRTDGLTLAAGDLSPPPSVRGLPMCGIAGIFDIRGKRPIDRELLARMTEALHHRGPDDGGYHISPGTGLGHRRLSIIDLSPLGHQPLFNEDGTVCVTFN